MKNTTALALASAIALSTSSGIAAQTKTRTASPPAAPAMNAREQRIAREAEAMRDRLIAQRRDFHINPELSNREERTARVVAERLRAIGLEDIKTGVAKHGVTAILRGGLPGAVVAVRADMDALPIEENIDVPYKSKNAGVKHACGHDVHTSVGLGVAEILAGMKSEIPGTIKFIFQPAEEGPPVGEEGGAKLMVKEGALQNPRPQAIFGLHVMPTVEVGKVSFNSGATMASSDRFTIHIRGKKVHGAYPHEGIDAIAVAAETVSALQTIRSRRTDTIEPLVISVGIIEGGNRFNIIADDVKLEGTIRALDEGVRQQAHVLMRNTVAGITSAFGATFDLEFQENAALTYNDPALVEETLPVMRRVMGADNIIARRPQMGAEDFAYFQREIPGFYYFLGVGNRAKGITAMIHTPEFDVDEDSLVIGTRVMANVLVDYLERHRRDTPKVGAGVGR